MAELKITGSIENIDAARSYIQGQLFPTVSKAVSLIAEEARKRWIVAVDEARLWSGEKRPYAASIKWQMTGPLSALVWSDYRYAKEIEEGRPAKDLKRMLDTSQKVRRTRAGKRFLIIPFRHNVADMPADVYQEAKQLAPSRVVGQGSRPAGEIVGFGMAPAAPNPGVSKRFLSSTATRGPVMVPKAVYAWGDKLAAGSLGPNPRGKTDRFAGMYRFDTSTPKAKRSTYLTFRVMMEGSPGWIVPPKPGLLLAKGVADGLQPKADIIFAEAVKRDQGV